MKCFIFRIYRRTYILLITLQIYEHSHVSYYHTYQILVSLRRREHFIINELSGCHIGTHFLVILFTQKALYTHHTHMNEYNVCLYRWVGRYLLRLLSKNSVFTWYPYNSSNNPNRQTIEAISYQHSVNDADGNHLVSFL